MFLLIFFGRFCGSVTNNYYSCRQECWFPHLDSQRYNSLLAISPFVYNVSGSWFMFLVWWKEREKKVKPTTKKVPGNSTPESERSKTYLAIHTPNYNFHLHEKMMVLKLQNGT